MLIEFIFVRHCPEYWSDCNDESQIATPVSHLHMEVWTTKVWKLPNYKAVMFKCHKKVKKLNCKVGSKRSDKILVVSTTWPKCFSFKN